jgi:hypothetical protein
MSVAAYLPRAQWQVLGAFAVAAVVLIGWGSVFRRLCGGRMRDVDDLCGAMLEGWALLLATLQVWHFFFAVDDRAALFAVAVAVVGLALAGTEPWIRALRAVPRNLPALVILLGAAVWLSQLALEGPRHGDSGDVYIPTTLWMRAYPVVVGLGNLHAPYAYNASYFLWAAAAAVGPFAGRPFHVVNSVLLMGLVARGVLGLWRVVWPARRPRSTDLYFMLLLPGALALALGIFFTTPSPDVGVFIIGAALFGSVLEVAVGEAPAARFHLLAVVLFALAGWTIKLAFAGMAIALLVVVPLGWWWRFRPAGRDLWRLAVAVAAIACFVLVPWLAANVLMSGSPFFPSAVGALDVPWRVHRDVQEWIQSDKYVGPVQLMWAEPGWVWRRLLGFGWGEPEVALPLVVAACAVVVAPLLAVTRLLLGRRPHGERVPFWVLVPPLASLAFALRLTPMPRYAGATMWLLGIGALLVVCGSWLRRSASGRGAAIAATIAMSVWLASKAPTLWPGHTDFGHAPVIPTDVRVLASGLEVNVPRGDGSCFAAPLPCAPPPDPRLKLRHPGDLGGGFEVESHPGDALIGPDIPRS